MKDAAGCVQSEGKIGSTRYELDAWVRTLPQPRMMAMEVTIFTGWIYDYLLSHAEKLKVAHPLMLRAIAAAKRKNDKTGSSLAMDTSALHRLISLSEVDQSLFKAGGLRRRIQLLYELDVYLDDNNEENALVVKDPLYKRARALQGRMEALNSNIYLKLRDSILRGADPGRLRRWLRLYGYEFSSPAPGLGYDDLDELMSGVLQLREPVNAAIHGPEMVFYQPTPARHIVDLIDVGGLSETDVLVDLGAGLGHVPILASMLTGCRGIGVELERAYVESARDCVGRLALKRVAFVQQDAREADLSAGSVFYLYTPFTGTTLSAVVAKLKKEAEKRVIRVCTLGPCAQVIAQQTWLTSSESPHADRITCFYSRAR